MVEKCIKTWKEYGPAGNLRKTPGRVASHCERKTQNQGITDIVETPKGKRRKRSSEKKKLSKSKTKSVKTGKLEKTDKAKTTKIVDRQPSVRDFLNTGQSVAKSLLQNFNELAEKERCATSTIKVLDRIKRFEEGYATDPEIELRKYNISDEKVKQRFKGIDTKHLNGDPKFEEWIVSSQPELSNTSYKKHNRAVRLVVGINVV